MADLLPVREVTADSAGDPAECTSPTPHNRLDGTVQIRRRPVADELVWHYSEDPSITVFRPHLPPTSALRERRVRAVSDPHTVHAIEWGRLEQVRSARVLIRMRSSAPPGR